MKIGDRITNPGELRTKVTLLRRSIATDSGGFQTAVMETIANVWAMWENVHGQEVWAAAVHAQQAATVLVRYRSDLDETCYVRKGSMVYEIVSLDNIRERGEYIELKVKRFVEG